MGGCTVGQFSGGAVLVGLGQVAFCVCQAGYAASRVVEVVGGSACLVEELLADPVYAVGVGGVGAAVDVLLYQDFHVLAVHVVDVLYQLVLAGEGGSCGRYEVYKFLLCGADLAVCFQLDACAIVVAVVIGAVVAGKVLVFLRVVVHLVDPVAVPVIGRGHLEGPVVGVAGVHCLQAVFHGVLVGGLAVVGGAVLL